MFQMKDKAKLFKRDKWTGDKQNLPDVEFKTIIINVFADLTRRMDKHSKNINKQKMNQSQLKNTIN